MELSKVTLIALASCALCTSCALKQQEMSEADSRLLQKSLETSMTPTSLETEDTLSFYSALPRSTKEALTSYNQMYQYGGMHDYDYLQKLGIRFLEESLSEFDPESQLLSIYGASIAKNNKLLPILEKALSSEHPQVQIAAIRALSDYHDDDADRILVKGMQSNYLEVCFETAFVLALNKHPEAMGYIESLMNKVPDPFHYLFPTLYAILDTPQSSKSLKKFFQSPDQTVRVEAILSAARVSRYDLLPSIRSLSLHHEIAEQEACAFTLGHLQDEASVSTLEELMKSPSEYVALSAMLALYKLGRSEVISDIESLATQGNIFAIQILRDCHCDEKILEALAYHPQEQVRLNAGLALLKKKNPLCLTEVRQILVPNQSQLFVVPAQSPGKALAAKKWTLASPSTLRSNPFIKEISNQVRREILTECLELPESLFLTLASEIVDSGDNDLIPDVIALVQSLKTSNAIALLKEWQRKVGHPYVRAWSNLALFNLDQNGPWKENIISWVKKQKYHPMIRLKPIVPWSKKSSSSKFELTAEEKSQLLIQSYLAIALRQEEGGIEMILSHLDAQNSKNKYALAGILIKATE
ncbi:MAG: hypothetical protein S4CHLAM7_05610 [Chlamydiae bacterium]|nr:hypothetical protein [Chlamydiota bacterium]